MSVDTIQHNVNKRYELLDKLGAGGMGAVFRARDRLNNDTVALKRVLAIVDQPQSDSGSQSTSFNLALSREFRTLASLRHPNIVTVNDFGFDEDQNPYFTMSLVEDAKTLLEAAQEQSTETRVGLIVELLQALSYLHRRGILHRDLKPGNVLVNRDGRVKMLDFGLSLATSYSMSNMETGVVGTLAYMAPELFEEEESTIATDLYAAGVVAYEVFTGKKPFESNNVAMLLNRILNSNPDLSLVEESIEPVIERLLSKNPADRYTTAIDALNAICAVTNYPLPQETQAIRESFLQSAPMVGRRDELNQLRHMLNAAIEGKGGFQLISGESGVGKSRLVDELRIRALIKGVLVLRGQAVSEGGATYHMWRELLRHLVVHSDLEPEEAGILKSVVPDIDNLLGQDVEATPALTEPMLTQNRLFRTIRAIIMRQMRPLLIILEDLQWAGVDSLALLNYLIGILNETRMMIVADYRDDEKPEMPELVGNPPNMRLERLSNEEIIELSAAMLGESGKQPHIVQLLQRETEGNAFFLVEVARALAEEAGQLGEIGKMTLPQTVFSGSINTVIERRLNQVPDDARQLLELAAIAGRQIDKAVLQALRPEMDIEAWLTTCANVSVIEILDENWHFAHNKLRERIVEHLDDKQRPSLYRQVAEAIEATYPDEVEQAATLAHLWYVAGDEAKELGCCKLAGLQAVGANADSEAIPHLQRALELIEKLPNGKEKSQLELDIRIPMSIAITHTQGFTTPELEKSWLRSQELCTMLDNPPETVGVLWGLCGMYMVRGDNDIAANMDDEIFELAPSTPAPNLTRVQALYTRTINLIAMGQIQEALDSARECLRIYDPNEAQQAIAIYGSNPGITVKVWEASMLVILGYPEQGQELYHSALDEARELNHPFTLSNILAFCWISQVLGNVDEAFLLASENMELAQEYAFGFNIMMGMPVLGWAIAQRGELEKGVSMIQQALGMLHGMGANLLRAYFLGILADSFIKVGQMSEAVEVVDEALERIETSVDRFYEPEIYRLKGELLWTLDDNTADAETYIQKAIDVAKERNVRWFELRSTVCMAKLWQSQGKSQEAYDLLKPIVDWFTEGFDTSDLQEAKQLLEELQA